MDLSAYVDAIRPGLTDMRTGSLAPDPMWDLAGLAAGTEDVRHAIGFMSEDEGVTTWSITMLTPSRIIRCFGKTSYEGWQNGSEQLERQDTVDLRAEVRPLSCVSGYRISDIRKLHTGGDWAAACRYTFELDGKEDLVLDAAAASHAQIRDRVEAAATFLIESLEKR